MRAALLLLAAAGGTAGPAAAQEARAADRVQGYSLSDPVPTAAMREFTPDRPSVTESPYTVDAGHVQIELSAAEYAIGRDRSRILDVLPVNLKLGLLDNVDVELLFTPYQRMSEGGSISSGFGDETLMRLKINLQGNDGEGTAFAVMPYVKVPTGTGGLSNHHVEAGLILPMEAELPGDFTFNAMLEADLVYHDPRRAYGTDLVHSASLGHSIAGTVNGYVEYVGIAPFGAPHGRESHYQAIGSAGLTVQVRDNLILDAGSRVGFSGDSDRAALFLGASTRF